MFTRISALLAVAVAVATTARMERHALVQRNSPQTGNCNTGEIKCCNTITNASEIKSVLDMLSMEYAETDNVGITCTPFNIGGAGESASCQQQPVCCTNNAYDGFINVGCSPFDFN